jgi:hypothetical protein
VAHTWPPNVIGHKFLVNVGKEMQIAGAPVSERICDV